MFVRLGTYGRVEALTFRFRALGCTMQDDCQATTRLHGLDYEDRLHILNLAVVSAESDY